MLNRRNLLAGAAGGGLALSIPGVSRAWARPASQGNIGISRLTGTSFDLAIDQFPVRINGRPDMAIGVNGGVPAPLLRWREGDDVTLNVTNHLDVDTSIHWHGILLPFQMDGVPGLSFPGIRPGETFSYRFPIKQSGTYWYHSHSGLQEQIGHFGPIVIDPKEADPVLSDREYVLVLSDWPSEDPHQVFSRLKKQSDAYNFQERTVGDFLKDVSEKGLGDPWSDRAMWGQMRMSPRDISDTTGATYAFLINGHTTADNWNALFAPGERIRLRIINASAMTLYNFRIPGLPMTVVAADGLNVQPVETDEFQIGVAETYDVIVTPTENRAYAVTAESIDRSGQVVASLTPRTDLRAEPPGLRDVPTLTMTDMAMDHGSMASMGDGSMNNMDHGSMDHGSIDHSSMDHGAMPAMNHDDMDQNTMPTTTSVALERGPGVDMIAMAPTNRLDHPGLGLENVAHRTLTYSQLRSLAPNPDTRAPGREMEIHLTGNMHRYMWSFDGVKFSEITEAITFHEGERLRVTLVNDTMMSHPIHLHGMFFELENGAGAHKPRKHTVIVKPGEKLSFDVTADAVGDWAFHCHLLYHMHAGMMQVVQVLPSGSDVHDHDSGGDHGDLDHSTHTAAEDAPVDHSGHTAQEASPPGDAHDHSGHAPPADPDPHAGHANHGGTPQ